MRATAAALVLLLVGCPRPVRVAPGVQPTGPAPGIELGESWPIETALDHADIPDAAGVWLELVASARERIALAEFYVSNQPGTRLEAVVAALEAAAARGVAVRLLVDSSFAAKYPDTLARLAAGKISVRRFDVGSVMGGVLHAKYFVVDGREAWVGSQNFDWRSLEHIQELGVRLREPAAVKALEALFEADWDVAGGAPASRYAACAWPTFPVKVGEAAVTLAASPRGFLCGEQTWDLPILLGWIEKARVSVKVQLLTYKAKSRQGAVWTELDEALRRAAARGVQVHLLVSSWGAREPSVAALASVPNVRVGVLTIPAWSGGEIPYARVAHAKLMAVDGARAWIGTSNWERDYFTSSRNVSVFIDGGPVAARVDRLFDENAASAHAAPLRRDARIRAGATGAGDG